MRLKIKLEKGHYRGLKYSSRKSEMTMGMNRFRMYYMGRRVGREFFKVTQLRDLEWLYVFLQSYTGRLGRLKWSALEFIHLANEAGFAVVCLSVCLFL